MAFTVVSAQLVGPLTLRVTFGAAPRAFDPTLSNDALNPANYTLSGPKAATIKAAAPTSVTAAIDVYVGEPLTAGSWTLTVASSVQDLTATGLQVPRSATFAVTVAPSATSLQGGASEEGILRKHLNPALQGEAWDHLIAALEGDPTNEVGDRYVQAISRRIVDQMFLPTASEDYLDRRAGEVDVHRPESVGLGDGLFRRLAVATSNHLVTPSALATVLEIFYGPDAVRAALTSGLQEPFALQDGDDLRLTLGSDREVAVTFSQKRFARAGAATALEVATALNLAFADQQVRAFAAAVTDPTTSLGRVTIYADARGVSSRIRATGGRAWVGLRFPGDVFPSSGLSAPYATWTITVDAATGRVRFQTSGTTAYDLSLLRTGDMALIYGRQFDAALAGTHEVLDVSVTYSGATKNQWFEVAGTAGAGTVVQNSPQDLAFLRPAPRTIHDADAPAYVVPTEAGLEAVIPTTTQAVERGNGTGAYLAMNPDLSVTAVDRGVTGSTLITTSSAHGLSVGSFVFLDGVRLSVAAPSVSAGATSGSLGASHA
jgi:hypothetical protein